MVLESWMSFSFLVLYLSHIFDQSELSMSNNLKKNLNILTNRVIFMLTNII